MVSMAMAQIGTPTVTSDATNVYYKIPYSGSPSFVRVFIDNDHQASTGYPANGIGARYLIENGNLYRYAGSNGSWNWTWIKNVPYAVSGGTAAISIARSDLSPSAIIDSVAQVASPTYTALKLTTTLFDAGAISPPPTGATSQVSYAAGTEAIANPERGFYNQIPCSDSVMNQAQLTTYRASANQSLVMCLFLMSEAINAPLAQTKLDLLQRQFDTVRAAGVKMVLRFAYNDSGNALDAPLSRMMRHMDQLKPILRRNSDVLAVVQAGFIGSWGEWADSLNYGTGAQASQQNWSDRKTVLNKVLDMVPAERMVQLRMPDFAYKLVSTTALSASEAFNGSAKARVGQHNDCFLATDDDWGTYYSPSTDFPWLAAQTTYTPMGGETCIVNQPRSDCPTAVSEMGRFHWSFINSGYNDIVLSNWRVQGCYETINQKLGYRFVLRDGSFSNSGKPGGGFAFNLNLVNDGYAAPFNRRPVQLVLRNNASGTVYRIALSVDPRKWLPGQTININQTVTLPSAMESGNYSVMLNLPDAAASIGNRPEYAIQLANSNTWEAGTGFNKLNHTASIAP